MGIEEYEVSEAKVTYTTKELLLRIDQRFDRLEKLAQDTPSRNEFDSLVARVVSIEAEAHAAAEVATALANDSSSRFNRNDKIILIGFALITLVLNILALGPDIIG